MRGNLEDLEEGQKFKHPEHEGIVLRVVKFKTLDPYGHDYVYHGLKFVPPELYLVVDAIVVDERFDGNIDGESCHLRQGDTCSLYTDDDGDDPIEVEIVD